MVFDVTNFYTKPASLAAFWWVDGNHSPQPWLAAFREYAYRYKCIGKCAFDATGTGAGYNEPSHGIQELMPWPVKFTGSSKYMGVNLAKTLMGRGLILFPNIPMLWTQLSKYRLPDDKIRQDLVMCIVVACMYLNYIFYFHKEELPLKEGDQAEESYQSVGRYRFHRRERGFLR